MYRTGMSTLVTTDLGRLVFQRREELGLTQRELAEMVGITHTYVYNIEKGKNEVPSRDVMAGLARALRVSEERLWRAVGIVLRYADAATDALAGERDVTPEELWAQVLARFGGDKEKARQFMLDVLRETYDD